MVLLAAQVTLLTMAAHCCRAAPCCQLATPWGSRATLEWLATLLSQRHNFAVQDAALCAAAAAAAARPPYFTGGFPAVSMVQPLLGLLTCRVADARSNSHNSSSTSSATASCQTQMTAWQSDLFQLLHQYVVTTANEGTLADVAAGLVTTLSHVAAASPDGSLLQAEAVHLVADIVSALPSLLDLCAPVGCLTLLLAPTHSQSSHHIVSALPSLLDLWPRINIAPPYLHHHTALAHLDPAM